jgi:hypothetical protein
MARLAKFRNEWLASDETELLEAGGKTLEKYGEFNLVYTLAGGDPTKFEQVLDVDYITILTTLRYNKDVEKVRKKMNKNLNEQIGDGTKNNT